MKHTELTTILNDSYLAINRELNNAAKASAEYLKSQVPTNANDAMQNLQKALEVKFTSDEITKILLLTATMLAQSTSNASRSDSTSFGGSKKKADPFSFGF